MYAERFTVNFRGNFNKCQEKLNISKSNMIDFNVYMNYTRKKFCQCFVSQFFREVGSCDVCLHFCHSPDCDCRVLLEKVRFVAVL